MCNFCYLKVPAHSPLAKNTQIGALYNLFHFMHDKITQTEIIFWNNEPLILQNRTCLLEYDFIYCGTSIIFLWGRGCHMNAGRLVWLVCTNPPPSLAPGGERRISSRAWPTCSLKHTAVWIQPCLSATVRPLIYTFPLLCAEPGNFLLFVMRHSRSSFSQNCLKF